MESILARVKKPSYSDLSDVWSYDEMKMYFNEIVDCPLNVAACTFLSNAEGLGDYLDKHPFFDFQAYLVIASFGLAEGFVYSPETEEYVRLKENLDYYLTGKCDTWSMSKYDRNEMKKDAQKVWDAYYKEEE